MTDGTQRRWRLLLGEPAEAALGVSLNGDEQIMDRSLAALYDPDTDSGEIADGTRRSGGLGASAPRVVRWLGDIRSYFPSSVVQVMQRDAVDRLHLTSMLLEPELLDALQPDVHLVATLVSLSNVMPETTRATARQVVAQVVAEIERRVADQTRSAVRGALNRASRTARPRPRDIDWNATIGANLKHYLPEQRTVVPERLVGYSRRSSVVAREIVVAIDQSGSMAESLVYAAVFAATLATIRSVKTSLVAFDTEIADLSDLLSDPVEVLFGCQLGGGTDINRAVAYCAGLITRPTDTVFVLISDLYEGGVAGQLLSRVAALVEDGVSVLVLLALSDAGAPSYDHDLAAALAELGVPAFACTPDRFPDLLAVVLSRGDAAQWAAKTELESRSPVTAGGSGAARRTPSARLGPWSAGRESGRAVVRGSRL